MPQASTRREGGKELYARFPSAHALWAVHYEGGHPFTMTAYAINGVIVLIQQFDMCAGWEAYVPASKSNRITDIMNAIRGFTK